MPVFVATKACNDTITSIAEFLNSHHNFKVKAEELKSSAPSEVLPQGLLYVGQREFAVISPDDACVKVLGSEDATTCHIVVIRHSGTGVTGLSHCDGCDMERGLHDMVSLITNLSQGGPDGRLEVTLAGGFIDKKKESEKLSKEIIGILQTFSEDLHVVCLCITDYNNTTKKDVNFPVIYGLAVEVRSGHIYPATFPEKGPELDVRSACHFGGFKLMMNIFDNTLSQLVIGPFTWEPWDEVNQWLSLPDSIIRKYLSTSPEQEPVYFEAHVRSALKVLSEHPNPELTLFPENQPHRYSLQKDGSWTLVDDDLS